MLAIGFATVCHCDCHDCIKDTLDGFCPAFYYGIEVGGPIYEPTVKRT